MLTISAVLPGRGYLRGRDAAGVDALCIAARAMLEVAGMHAIFFGLKRAHHGTLRITRDVLGHMGLTAARFDMLYAVRSRPRAGIRQSALARMLGVCRATVSRMLTSLEELGLVTRTADLYDRRQKVVNLTTLGRWRIAFAHRQLVGSGWVQLAVDSALGAEGSECSWYRREESVAATGRLDTMLGRLRRAFFDRARLDYPWDPRLADEIDPVDEALDELTPE